MPVIVAANPKGGSGKSTTCVVLGTTLASQGATVRIIDADPQRTLARWGEGESAFSDIVVTPSANEDLTVLIDDLQSKYQFVLIDVQGTANQEMVSAMSRADLVLIPMQAKTADAEVATRAISLLRTQENLFKRKKGGRNYYAPLIQQAFPDLSRVFMSEQHSPIFSLIRRRLVN